MRPPSLPRRLGKSWRILLGSALLVLITASVLAQSGFPLQGTVTNSVTGEVIRRASVQALGPRPRAALTDDDGHFRLEGLPEGEVPIMVTKPGYLSEQAANPTEQATTVARIGPGAPALTLELIPQSVIFGRVTAADGEPLEDIPVQVARIVVANGRRTLAEQNASVTNDNGEFRAANLPAGTYYVAAGPSSRLFPGAAGVANPREATYAQIFYPGVPSMELANLVAVRAGQETEASMELGAEPVFRVSGVVIGYVPGSFANLQFVRTARDGPEIGAQFDAQTGKFEAKVRGGIYHLRGMGGQGAWEAAGDAPVAVNSDTTGIHVTMMRLPSIAVTARVESSRNSGSGRNPSAGGAVGLAIALTSHHNLTGQSDYETEVTPGRTAALTDIEPESYRVTLITADGWWVQAAESGGVDLLGADLTVASGAHPSPIQIVLRDDVASLTGTVSGMKGAKSGTVLLLPPADSRREVKTTTVSPQGAFEFSGIAPGTYGVLALERTGGIEYTKREALEGYISKAVETTLSPNGSGTVQLELARVEQ